MGCLAVFSPRYNPFNVVGFNTGSGVKFLNLGAPKGGAPSDDDGAHTPTRAGRASLKHADAAAAGAATPVAITKKDRLMRLVMQARSLVLSAKSDRLRHRRMLRHVRLIWALDELDRQEALSRRPDNKG